MLCVHYTEICSPTDIIISIFSALLVTRLSMENLKKKERKKEKMERGWLVYTGEGVRVKRGTNITDSNVQQRIYSILYSMYICIGEGGCYNNNRNTEKERRVYYSGGKSAAMTDKSLVDLTQHAMYISISPGV